MVQQNDIVPTDLVTISKKWTSKTGIEEKGFHPLSLSFSGSNSTRLDGHENSMVQEPVFHRCSKVSIKTEGERDFERERFWGRERVCALSSTPAIPPLKTHAFVVMLSWSWINQDFCSIVFQDCSIVALVVSCGDDGTGKLIILEPISVRQHSVDLSNETTTCNRGWKNGVQELRKHAQ